MIIRREICVGCGRCHPYCPAGAIHFEGLKSTIGQEACYECGCCFRARICPVDAIEEPPEVYGYPRAVRKCFSDPNATHVSTGIQGRGTEESKTNDVTKRCPPGTVGVLIEVGRPTLGMSLREAQKITRALARAGIRDIESNNPFYSLIEDIETGDLKPELLEERVLSAIIEIRVGQDRLRHVLSTVKRVAEELDSVFCLDLYTVLEEGLRIPEAIKQAIEAEGLAFRPNGKVNLGLGLPQGKEVDG